MYGILDTKIGKLIDEGYKTKAEAKKIRDEKNLAEHGEKYNEVETLKNGCVIYPHRYGARYKVCRTDDHPKGASYKKAE